MKELMKGLGAALIIGAILIGVLWTLKLGALGAPAKTPVPYPTRTPIPAEILALRQEGFREWEDGLYYKWMEKGEFSCPYSGTRCWGLEVVSSYGCQDLYGKITILDAEKYNIGWTNDTATGIRSMERVVLIFDTFESRAKYARIAELNCRP